MKSLIIFTLFLLLTQAVFSQLNDDLPKDKFTTIAQSINDKIASSGKLKRKIIFTQGGEFFLSYEERWNFFSLVPFTGKEDILKNFKNIISYNGGIIVYETVADEFEVTIQVAENNYTVVSRFDKKKDAVYIYKKMILLKSLCKQY